MNAGPLAALIRSRARQAAGGGQRGPAECGLCQNVPQYTLDLQYSTPAGTATQLYPQLYQFIL